MDFPHRRYNPLSGAWVLVSPHRALRPWQGAVEKPSPPDLPAYDPTCYLCPGNARVGGVANPDYTGTYVFDNDFPALLAPQAAPAGAVPDGAATLFQAEPVAGICRVVCFSPRHDLSLPQMSPAGVTDVLRTWRQQTLDLGADPAINYVQVFENKGAAMGCSNPHPHSQVWASSHIPEEPAAELRNLVAYRQAHGSCLLCDYAAEELARGERVVAANDDFVALVPFWAVWPFEVLLVARKHVAGLPDLDEHGLSALAEVLRQVTIRYDNLFQTSFPYSMGFHQAPSDGAEHAECHLHAHFYPPLLRSATVRKFMVGYEMLAMPQRDLTPEAAAERLRALSETHYLG